MFSFFMLNLTLFTGLFGKKYEIFSRHQVLTEATTTLPQCVAYAVLKTVIIPAHTAQMCV